MEHWDACHIVDFTVLNGSNIFWGTKLRNQICYLVGLDEPDVVVVSVFSFDDPIVSKSVKNGEKWFICIIVPTFYVQNPLRFFGEGLVC